MLRSPRQHSFAPRGSEVTNVDSAEAARFVGARTRRKEDPRLLSGQGRYVGDVKLPRMGHVAFVRSPYPKARIDEINTDDAKQAPGVLGVLRAEDLNEGLKLPGAWRGSILAHRYTSYAGEPVVMVVADSRAEAEDAAELVEVTYSTEQAVVDLEAAIAGEITAHPGDDSNLFDQTTSAGYEHVDAIIAAALRLYRTHRAAPLRALPDGDPRRRGRLALGQRHDDDLDLHPGSTPCGGKPLRDRDAASTCVGAGARRRRRRCVRTKDRGLARGDLDRRGVAIARPSGAVDRGSLRESGGGAARPARVRRRLGRDHRRRDLVGDEGRPVPGPLRALRRLGRRQLREDDPRAVSDPDRRGADPRQSGPIPRHARPIAARG